MKTLFSFYNLKLPIYFVYMLQQVEYEPRKFIDWLQRLSKDNKKINSVMNRKNLVMTANASLLIFFGYFLSISLLLSVEIFYNGSINLIIINYIVVVLTLPYFLIIGLSIVTQISRFLIIGPKNKKLIVEATEIFDNHKGIKVAVLGSYGKTTMKEILTTLISEGKVVSATPGNMNTITSQAKFAKSLSGNEEVVILEFGEGEPGDIKKMSSMFKPSYAIITGLSPNHLDKYLTIESVADDLFSIYDFVKNERVYLNKESKLLYKYAPKNTITYSSKVVLGWNISNIIISVTETKFVMKKSDKYIDITAKLLGRHQVAPIAIGVALVYEIGLSKDQILVGCSKLTPYEHRMQPRSMNGAWLIDDTYNGNLEGLVAGLNLLDELDMNRKWYVTPGLVDQGNETEHVHVQLGKNITRVNPDIVVLMDNSVRPIIEKSMSDSGFKGELRVEANPLNFYNNIEHIIASGDVVMMQNDWTDNYN